MRAPPEAATMISGLRVEPRPVHGARNRLAHHRAHRSADEGVLHGAQHHCVRPQLAHRVQDRVVQAGLFLRLAQPLLVGLHIGKVQRIGRAQTAVHQLIARLEQQIDALAAR